MKNFVLAIAVSAAVLLFGGVSFAVDYDSADYFPLEVDNEWIYNDGADDTTNAVTGIHEPSGAYVYTYGMDGSARYYTNDGTGLLMHGIYDDFFGGDPA